MSDDHNVFISWSGARSKWVAAAMMEWLPVVLQSVRPWMSSTSIGKGTRSANEISEALRSVKMGIVCLTPENLEAPWLLFEAGALSNAVAQKTHVCTYLLGGLTPSQVEKPLGEFQHTSPDKEDTLKLLRTMNAALDGSISDLVLSQAFEGQWPAFEKKLKTMPAEGEEAIVKRSPEDMLSEVLETTRAQADLVRAMQTQITHVEQALNRVPLMDWGIPFSSAIPPNAIHGSYVGPLFVESKDKSADNLTLIVPPETSQSGERQSFRVVSHSDKDSKKK